MNAPESMHFLDDAQWNGLLFLGEWVPPLRRQTVDVIEPATGHPLTCVGLAEAEDMSAAAQAAAAAQPAWVAMAPRDRAEVFRRAAALFSQHFDELSLAIARETGGVLFKGQHEVREAITLCHLAAGMPLDPQGQVLASPAGCLSYARRAPFGVVGVISPFNFPLILTLRSVAPALAAGNAVVVKPDLRTPVSGGYLIARIFAEAGLPAGLLHVLPGGAEAGEALVAHPRVPMIAFTGSPAVGRRIGELAGRHLKKVSLELGGANALIILDDADLDLAVSNAAWAAWLHQGQICMAANRILVHASLADELTARLVDKARHLPVGDGASGKAALGPLIDRKQLQRVHALVQDSVAAGARLLAGGTYERLFYRPTVLGGVRPGMRVFEEEVFGPVANIIVFHSDDEAVELANNSQGGLSAGVISASVGRAMALGQRLRVGMVHINDQTVNDDCVNPFGGPGIAGNGTSVGGPADWEEYTQWQWTTVKARAPQYPL
ncbi:benzaldehyde dehydrogenase [Trinickia caryophylli]|uniref:Benzaldehyde dehydrogenase (NAD+) n=1 Tax=Trinickia caryophylli TaxID=28094 RepID=A0A1X7GFX4_TRICW|nr:benzaldehyde dehydrogenase [Trinickia caryophylli]PMS10766.1 benzaldehyde dehydrogenase [Trinickia caryophylli]TRX13857.1 aldehyde dehydrogenase family protein [Trinickia caryophylli]WQE15448.1 benzaldehyde dehydrogenase [Trinickia caryophylli]SMF68503.1 benzaldehyde dehydrogenase (NAD+) [Trinickia caryophylli]GLU33812.1 aldehyde dehydrogenase [Trinickia caryophylli]